MNVQPTTNRGAALGHPGVVFRDIRSTQRLGDPWYYATVTGVDHDALRAWEDGIGDLTDAEVDRLVAALATSIRNRMRGLEAYVDAILAATNAAILNDRKDGVA